MSKNYSTDIASRIDNFLRNDDWRYQFDEERGVFKFGLNLHSKLKEMNYLIRVKNDCYIVYGIFPIGGDADDISMMQRLAEFVCRANYGLLNGSFELDFRDGEVRFKSYVDCDDNSFPCNEVIRNSIHYPAAMAERYSDGMLNIIFTSISPEAAIEKCEGDSVEQLRRLLDRYAEENGDTDSSDADEEKDSLSDDLFGEGGEA